MKKRRVVITGMGVVAPNGIGIDNFWDSLVHGRSGVRKITHFDASSYPSQIAAEVPDFNPTDYIDPKTARRLGRFAHLAIAASEMAAEDSELDFSNEDPYRVGVYLGTAMGGADVIEAQHTIFMEKGLKRISPFTPFSCSTHSAAGMISCRLNLKGSNTTISAGCNSGLDAAFLAFNAIRLNDADVMIAGASEAPITPYIHGAFCATGFLSRGNGDPRNALKPYDIHADGTVIGEGAAVLIMEELKHAIARKAKIYGEVISYSSLNEAFDFVEVDANSETMARTFEQALKNAKLDIGDIDYINGHGNGMLSYDIIETNAIKRAFGELAYHIPVTSIKPITGQSFSATGIFQVIASLMAIKESIIPPTMNLHDPAPDCDLNYVPNSPINKKIETALVNTHGFGGRLTVLIVRRFSGTRALS